MFKPNYENIVKAAKNEKSDRIPIYEHNISPEIMERITGEKFANLIDGSYQDKLEFFTKYNLFQKNMGYDAVTFEGTVIDVMPGNGCLTGSNRNGMSTLEEFESYPWDSIADKYFEKYSEVFKALRETMPDGMKAIGGVGNGVFECVQDIVGLENLCYIKADDEDMYNGLFAKVGDMLCEIWERFLNEFGDIYCVCRFGDDLGFKSSTLLTDTDIKELIIPQYKKIINIIHKNNKPFLLHSCGCIFNVMDDLIDVAGIDAKHSNEDQIAPYKKWIDDYGDKIGNFGGLDTDCLCDVNECDIVEYTTNIFELCAAKGKGVAIGSGNSIPNYVDPKRYTEAVNTIRVLRGDCLEDCVTIK